jgi:hypothetical protein
MKAASTILAIATAIMLHGEALGESTLAKFEAAIAISQASAQPVTATEKRIAKAFKTGKLAWQFSNPDEVIRFLAVPSPNRPNLTADLNCSHTNMPTTFPLPLVVPEKQKQTINILVYGNILSMVNQPGTTINRLSLETLMT